MPTTSERTQPKSAPIRRADPIDGRTARAVRTRDAIVDACIELVEEGDLRPTAPRIAERAGVSVRSIFQHFDDLETLFGAVGERVVARLALLVSPIAPEAPLDERIDAFARQAALLNEAVTPIRRAALVHAITSVVINQQFAAGHRFLQEQVARVFAAELEAAGPRRAAVEDTLVLGASWPAWDALRRLEGRSVEEAAASVHGVLTLALRPT